MGIEAGIAVGSAVGLADGRGSHMLSLHTPSLQSDVSSQVSPKLHLLQAPPPQSTSVSVPSRLPLVQVKDVGVAVVGTFEGFPVVGSGLDGSSVGLEVGIVEGCAVGSSDGRDVVGLFVGSGTGSAVGADDGEARHSSMFSSCFEILLRHNWVQICI